MWNKSPLPYHASLLFRLRGAAPNLAPILAQGYDVAAHVLACFGGAGGQHACAIARALGMSTIFVHRYAGILSAVGIGLADVVNEAQVRQEAGILSIGRKLIHRMHSEEKR